MPNKRLTVIPLFIVGLIFIVIPCQGKKTTYSWETTTIEAKAEGILYKSAMNSARDRILIKEATRRNGYQQMFVNVMNLPLDSTRNIAALIEEKPSLSDELFEIIAFHGVFPDFQYTSNTTAISLIRLQGKPLARWVSKYDIQPTKKEEKAESEKLEETEKPKEMEPAKPPVKEESQKTEIKRSKPVEPAINLTQNKIEIWSEITVAQNTTVPDNIRISESEAIVRGVGKDKLGREIGVVLVKDGIPLEEWSTNNPQLKPEVIEILSKHIVTGKPEWNEDKTVVKVKTSLDLKYVNQAVKEVEKKMKDAQETKKSADTTTQKPAIPAQK